MRNTLASSAGNVPGFATGARSALQRAGFRIVRVSAQLVLSDLAAAVALLRAAL
jgi:hypothetical protein